MVRHFCPICLVPFVPFVDSPSSSASPREIPFVAHKPGLKPAGKYGITRLSICTRAACQNAEIATSPSIHHSAFIIPDHSPSRGFAPPTRKPTFHFQSRNTTQPINTKALALRSVPLTLAPKAKGRCKTSTRTTSEHAGTTELSKIHQLWTNQKARPSTFSLVLRTLANLTPRVLVNAKGSAKTTKTAKTPRTNKNQPRCQTHVFCNNALGAPVVHPTAKRHNPLRHPD